MVDVTSCLAASAVYLKGVKACVREKMLITAHVAVRIQRPA